MENEKKANNGKIIFITAIICIVLCIPIGIILGKTLLGKNDKTNTNVINNANKINNANNTQNVSNDVQQNETLNCTKDNYKTCLPDVEDRYKYKMIYISSDTKSISDIQYFIADNLSYNITILLDGNVILKKSNKSYYTWDVIYNEKNIGLVNIVLNYYNNDNYIIFLYDNVSSIGSSLIKDKGLLVYDISNENAFNEKVNSISITDSKLNILVKTINLDNDVDKDKLCSNASMSNDIFGYKYSINLLNKEKSSNENILVNDFCSE